LMLGEESKQPVDIPCGTSNPEPLGPMSDNVSKL